MSMVRSNAFSGVVNQFYEAAVLPELLPNALHSLARACGAEGAALHLSNGLQTLGTVGSEGINELHEGFVKRWRAPELNSHRARGLDLVFRGWRGVLTEQDCFTQQELDRDIFHQDFFIRSGFSSFAGVILAKTRGSTVSTSIIRRIDQGTYAQSEIEDINSLASHLQVVSNLLMQSGLTSARRLADFLAYQGRSVALVGSDGRILHMNESFEALTLDGITIKNGRIGSWHPDANQKIAAAITRAVKFDGILRAPPTVLALPRRHGPRPLIASVVPVVGAAHDIFSLALAIVSVTDFGTEPVGPPMTAMQDAFGFTLQEARLAHEIALGKTLPEIAVARSISRETLRSRLKSVFNKTGTKRQAELVMVLVKLAQSFIS
jgi:DNA-binding CsgD family transcriptional regulator